MSQFGQELGSGFGGYFTRFFSIVTFGIGVWMMIDPSAAAGGDIPVDILMPAMLILGAHGMFTKLEEVGFFRKFLCYMGGVPGAVFAFNILGQILGM